MFSDFNADVRDKNGTKMAESWHKDAYEMRMN